MKSTAETIGTDHIPGLIAAAKSIAAQAGVQGAPAHDADAPPGDLRRPRLIELRWRLGPRHVERLQRRFRPMDVLAATNRKDDGVRVDLALH